ncbi:hypothetical protein D044_3543A, partial [Vibrio parahaemolyticus EKP-026]
MASATG